MSNVELTTAYSHDVLNKPSYKELIQDICDLNWTKLPQEDLAQRRVGLLLFLYSVSRVSRDRAQALP